MSGLIYKGSSPLKSSIHIPFRSNFWMFLMVRYQDYTIILDVFFSRPHCKLIGMMLRIRETILHTQKKNILTLW